MTTIRLFADDQDLKVVAKIKLASGNKKSVALQVKFSPEWDGYTHSAVFCTEESTDTVYEVLLTEGRCTIPHEVLADAGELIIGIRGVTPDAVKVSDRIKYKVADGAPTGTATAQGPTPDVYQQILEKLNDVTGVSPEDIKKAVAEYLAANPIHETDPTVPEWAKSKEKPSYTADEVGALSAETLPGAVNDALAQAKASGEFHGKPGEPGYTPQKGIDYWTLEDKQEIVDDVLAELPEMGGGGSGGSNDWVLVNTVTVEDDATSTVIINADSEGNSFEFREVVAFVKGTLSKSVFFDTTGNNDNRPCQSQKQKSAPLVIYANEMFVLMGEGYNPGSGIVSHKEKAENKKISYVRFETSWWSQQYFTSGTTITLYGRK